MTFIINMTEKQLRWQKRNRILMLGKYWVPSRELLVRALKIQFIATSIKMGYDIVIDNMNLNPKEIEFYKPYIEAHNQTVEELRKENILNPQDDFKYELEFKNFFIPLQDCIERDSKRPNPIGEEVIRKTYEKYKDILKV